LSSSIENKGILITKSKAESEKSVRLLIDAGAKLIYFPAIKIIPIFDSLELKEIGGNFNVFDYLIFTSVNSARIFSNFIQQYNLDLSNLKIAVVGKATFEYCKVMGIKVNFLPDEYSAKALLRKLSLINMTGKNILIPCSSLSRDELYTGLTALGANVKSVPIYNVVKNNIEELYEEINNLKKKPDVFLFTSPSSFENFLSLASVEHILNYFEGSLIAAIGSTTENAIRDFNLIVNIVPKIFTIEGASEAIIRFFNLTANLA
jgi:uroporphyrinogen III methyltransferase/synthase